MAAVDLSLLGRDLPDLSRYRAALSRSSVALSSEFNLPTDRQQLAAQGPYRADQRQRFQRPFSAAQRDLDVDAATELGRLNLRPFSSASTREVIAEAQRIVDKYRVRTQGGRWPTDSDTRRSLDSSKQVAPQPQPTPPPPPPPLRKMFGGGNNQDFDELPADVGGYRYGRPHQPPLRSPAALFAADPRRRSLATPLPSQEQRCRSRTEVEARREAMRILREVGLADAYRSQAEVQEAQQQQQQQEQQQQQQQEQQQQQQQEEQQQQQQVPSQHHHYFTKQHPPQQHPPPQAVVPALEEFASGARPLRTPLASSGYASYEEFQAKTGPSWRHPLPSHVAAGYCDEGTRRKVWEWLTAPDQLTRHAYLMKLCD